MAARAASANDAARSSAAPSASRPYCCIWQVMAVAYNLQQILPPPLAVARTIFDTLTLNYRAALAVRPEYL